MLQRLYLISRQVGAQPRAAVALCPYFDMDV